MVTVDYDPGASEVNQLNRIKLMIATAFENLEQQELDLANEEAAEKYVPRKRKNLVPANQTYTI